MLDPTHCQVFALMVTSYRGEQSGRDKKRSRPRKTRTSYD